MSIKTHINSYFIVTLQLDSPQFLIYRLQEIKTCTPKIPLASECDITATPLPATTTKAAGKLRSIECALYIQYCAECYNKLYMIYDI